MAEKRLTGVCFFGGFEPGYSRSGVLKRGLEARGIPLFLCRADHKKKVFKRYAALVYRYFSMDRDFSVIYVPEFRHKDVPLAWLLGRLTGKRVVFDPLVSRFETKIRDRRDAKDISFQAWYNRRIDKISLRLPDLILADTHAHAEYYSGEFNASPAKIEVLPVGFDDDLFNPREENPKKPANHRDKTVLFFGSYLPLHGVPIIVKAAALLEGRSDIRFVLIGGGQTFPETRAIVDEAGLQNIDFMPRVAYEELPRHILDADICLGIFAKTEKASRVIPNKIYQCLSMGKPLITADTGAIREIFADGENICLVQPENPAELAGKIVYLLDNPSERESIALEGQKLVREHFSSGVIGENFLRICKRVLNI